MTSDVDNIFDKFLGRETKGGCELCDALQRMAQNPDYPGVFYLRIYHDDWCPKLRHEATQT